MLALRAVLQPDFRSASYSRQHENAKGGPVTSEDSAHNGLGEGPDQPPMSAWVPQPAPTRVAPRSSIAHRHPVGLAAGSGLLGLVVGAFGAAMLIGLWAPTPPPPGWGVPPPPAWGFPPPAPPGAWGPPPPPFPGSHHQRELGSLRSRRVNCRNRACQCRQRCRALRLPARRRSQRHQAGEHLRVEMIGTVNE